MINFEMKVNSERLATQYRGQLLSLLNEIEEAADNYSYELSQCGVRVEVLDELNQLRDAVSAYKAKQRG